MQITQSFVHQLKAMQLPDNQAREMRAIAVARTLAYEVPISPGTGPESVVEEYSELFLDVVNAINETIALDTRLTRVLFQRFLKARIDVVNRATSDVLVQAVLESREQDDALSDDHRSALTTYLALSTTQAPQRAMSMQVRGLFEQRYPDAEARD